MSTEITQQLIFNSKQFWWEWMRYTPTIPHHNGHMTTVWVCLLLCWLARQYASHIFITINEFAVVSSANIYWWSCVHAYTNTLVHTHIYMYVCMYACMYICVWVKILIYVNFYFSEIFEYCLEHISAEASRWFSS